MKLKLSLLIFCLSGIGIFSHAQDKKKPQNKKPTVENGPDAIPVTVTSKKKAHRLPPPPPPRPLGKNGKPLPPPKIGAVKFAPPKIVRDKPAPPPPPKPKAWVKPVVPPVDDKA